MIEKLNKMNFDYALIIIIIPLILGFSVGYTSEPDEWYFKLKKQFEVPGIVFSIVWFFLYIFIGIAYYLALTGKPLEYWILPLIHLGLNLSFTPVLFKYKFLLLSSIIISIVLITAVYLMYKFYYWDKTKYAFLLFVPYILWLSFATYISWSIYYLNATNIPFINEDTDTNKNP